METPYMTDTTRPLDRRDFLRQSLAAASSSAAIGAVAPPSDAGFANAASPQEEADAFLAHFVAGWLPLRAAAEEADWSAATDVSEAHTAAQVARNLELNRYVGAPKVIATVRRLLEHKPRSSGDLRSAPRAGSGDPRPSPALSDRTARQLEKVRLRAAEAPGTVPEVVKARAEAEARQSATQDGFAFVIRRGDREAPASANDIDRILVESRDLDERRAAWEASKAIGRPLRDGLLRLRDLRNTVARAMGFDNFFALQVADYGMTVPETLALCDRIVAEVRPLYQQVHAWARHALANRYHAEAPRDGKLPAHWLSNRWGQNWPGLVEGVDRDAP